LVYVVLLQAMQYCIKPTVFTAQYLSVFVTVFNWFDQK